MNRMKLLITDCVVSGTDIILAAKDMNLLLILDVENSNIRILENVPSKRGAYNESIGAIEIVDNCIVVAPINDNYIWIYKADEKIWKTIEIKSINNSGLASMSIRQIKKYGDFVYLIGSKYPAIIKLDVKKGEIVDYIEKPFKDKGESTEAYFRSHGILKNETIYLASCNDNTVLEYNLKTDKYVWHNVGNSNYRYSGITFDGNDFWLAPRTNGPIVKWDGEKEYQVFDLPNVFNKNANYFLGVCYDGDNILFPNMVEEKSICIDKNTLAMTIIPKKYSMMKQVNMTSIISESYDGHFCCHINELNVDMMLSLETNKVISHFYDRNIRLIDNSKRLLENEACELNVFINYLSHN